MSRDLRLRLRALLLSFAIAPACTGGEVAGPTPIDGEWLVHFSGSPGVLSLHMGQVYAPCYFPPPLVGEFSLDRDSFHLAVNFGDGKGDLEYFGSLVRDDEDHFHLEIRDRRVLDFERYLGDCSEVRPAP